jgi:hypothetical protein
VPDDQQLPAVTISVSAVEQALFDAGRLTAVDIDSFIAVPELAVLASAVKQRLPFYDSCWQQIPQVSQGKQIDIILQKHIFRGATREYINDVDRLQQKILSTLEHLRPEMTATEGLSDDRVSIASMTSQMHDFLSQQGQPADSATVETLLQTTYTHNGGLLYLLAHPQARIIGQEDNNLNALHYAAVPWADRNRYEQDSARLMNTLRQERSGIAVYRLLSLMDREQLTYGVLIIGFAHAPELHLLCRRHGIKHRFLNAAQ